MKWDKTIKEDGYTFNFKFHKYPKNMNEYNGIICPNCGYETGIEPALVDPDAPMLYCPECDKPLFPPIENE